MLEPAIVRYRKIHPHDHEGAAMPGQIRTTLYTDPACPWAYSEIPALRVIDWRYGDQLDWRLVMIGLTESAQQYVDRGYTPLRAARGHARFRRYGMPFSPRPKARVSATARACRAIEAARLLQPGSEWPALRALQLGQFTTALVLDEDAAVAAVVAAATGLDAEAVRSQLDAPETTEAYERDRAETRRASGSAAELQGKTATTDGPVRFTASSVTFERDGLRLVAGGFQPVAAYDVLIANLDPSLTRRGAPDDPAELIDAYPDGLTTQEIAELLAAGNDAPDRAAAEQAMLEAVFDGRAERLALGDDAIWLAPDRVERFRGIVAAADASGLPLAVGA
jgi:protein-disulfide isomerase-like protein with CxxC motif